MHRFLSGVIRLSLLPGLLLLTLSSGVRASEQKILILGDSISAAYGMSLEQGWVAQLASQLQEQARDAIVVNASISGETSAGGLRQLPPLLANHSPALVIIELGANDGLRGYPLKDLQGNLTALVELSQQAGANVILVPMEIPPNYGQRYTSGFRATFDSVAQATGATLSPFILEAVATRPDMMQPDGIHPTVEAQPILLDTVLPTITEALDTL